MRFFTVLAVTALLIGLLSGCNNTASNETLDPDEQTPPITAMTVLEDLTVPESSVNAELDANLIVSSLQESIQPYAHLGVSIDTANALMVYEGQPVREIIDWNPETGETIIITESIGPNGFGGRNVVGAIDLTTVYENGDLVGMKAFTGEEYSLRTEERRDAVSP